MKKAIINPKSIVYSTRLDPRIIANLARAYSKKGRKFRTASSLINDALSSYTELLLMMAEGEGDTGLRILSHDDAVAYLVNDIRLETQQIRKAARMKNDEEEKREIWKLSEQERVRGAMESIQSIDNDNPAAIDHMEVAKKIRAKLKEEKINA